PGEPLVELDEPRSRLFLSEALLDCVACDSEKPVGGLPGPDALLERAIGVQERRLGDVLRVGVIAQDRVRVAIDLAAVTAVQVIDLARGEVAGFRNGHLLKRRSAAASPQPTSRILNTPHRKFAPLPTSSFVSEALCPREARRDMKRTLIIAAALLSL